jgi:hypothetical protein
MFFTGQYRNLFLGPDSTRLTFFVIDVLDRNKYPNNSHFYLCCLLLFILQVITNLVKMVKARDIRRPFCPAGHWLAEEVNIRADKGTVLLAITSNFYVQLHGHSFCEVSIQNTLKQYIIIHAIQKYWEVTIHSPCGILSGHVSGPRYAHM